MTTNYESKTNYESESNDGASSEEESLIMESVVYTLGQTTQSSLRLLLQAHTPEELERMYFISFSLPASLRIKYDGIVKKYEQFKQIDQYNFMRRKLMNHEWESITACYMIFEQTLNGFVHFHAIVDLQHITFHGHENALYRTHIHDFKCELYELFQIEKKNDLKYTFNYRSIDNVEGLICYFFKDAKGVKEYEKLNELKFKPLRLISKIINS